MGTGQCKLPRTSTSQSSGPASCLPLLHDMQNGARFQGVCGPPFERGMMWSTWFGSPLHQMRWPRFIPNRWALSSGAENFST